MSASIVSVGMVTRLWAGKQTTYGLIPNLIRSHPTSHPFNWQDGLWGPHSFLFNTYQGMFIQ